MTFPNPTLTWTMSDQFPTGSSAATGLEVIEAIKDAVAGSTGWTVVDGGDGVKDYVVLKPTTVDPEFDKMRVVFGANSTVQIAHTDNAVVVANFIGMSFAPNATDSGGTSCPIDTAGAATNWASTNIWSGVASTNPTPIKFGPCSTAFTTIRKVHVISSAEVLCVVFRGAGATECSPNWVGAMFTPLGNPGMGDAGHRLYGVSRAGSSGHMLTASVSAQPGNTSTSVFGKTYRAGETAGYNAYAQMKIYDTDRSVWMMAGVVTGIYSSFWTGTSTSRAANRDTHGNICMSRQAVVPREGSPSATSLDKVCCYGYLRQIYPWSPDCLDREVVQDSTPADIGFVVAPNTALLQEGWVHLNA